MTPPALTRRRALLGSAAALLGPWPSRIVFADDGSVVSATRPGTGPILLNGNENPYGPSPAARRAILDSMGAAPRYAEESIEVLRRQIALHEGVDPAQVLVGSGSGELLRMAGLLAARTLAGGELVAARPTYEELPEFAERLGLTVRWVDVDAEHRHDLDAFLRAITSRTSLVYVCNPNNPTGTTVATDQLAAFVRAVPGPVTVVVDEAYVDFTDVPGRSTAVGLLREAPNLVVLRTFSKLHGLAGLRVGYGIAPASLATRLGALSLVWPNSTGIAAATASLNDRGFLQATRTAIVDDRTRVQGALDRLGRPRADSKGNFVFFDTGRPVAEFQECMLAQGLRVGRRFAGYDTWSRVTIGVRDEVDRFLAALPGALKA
ncbi:MAG: hypothetical protein K0R70_696 [Steroidobacteraceae bacterium]|nr:hypothetical protein [Steroidobacteraceae bacterium]